MFLCMQYFQSRDLKYLPPITFLSHRIIGICWKRVQKKSKGSTLSFTSLPLPTHTECFSSVVRESCAGTSSELTAWVQSSHRLYRKTRPYQKLLPCDCGELIWGNETNEEILVLLNGWTCWRVHCLLILFTMQERPLRHTTKKVCLQKSSMGPLNIYPTYCFSTGTCRLSPWFLEMVELVWNADNERSIAYVPVAVLSWDDIKQQKGERVWVC